MQPSINGVVKKSSVQCFPSTTLQMRVNWSFLRRHLNCNREFVTNLSVKVILYKVFFFIFCRHGADYHVACKSTFEINVDVFHCCLLDFSELQIYMELWSLASVPSWDSEVTIKGNSLTVAQQILNCNSSTIQLTRDYGSTKTLD